MTPRRHGYGQHLLDGLGILWTRWSAPVRKWRTAGSRPGDAAVRTGVLIAVGLAVLDMLRTSALLLLGVALVLIVIALRTATKAQQSATAKTAGTVADAAEEEAADEQLPEVSSAEFLTLVHEVIGTARGVHLATLARALSAHYGEGWEIADVRRLCMVAGQPTRPSVRAPGAGPTVGIHREDLLPLPHGSAQGPAVAVVVAGQNPATPATTAAPPTATTPLVATIGGVRITTDQDPDHPHRHTVHTIEVPRRRRP